MTLDLHSCNCTLSCHSQNSKSDVIASCGSRLDNLGQNIAWWCTISLHRKNPQSVDFNYEFEVLKSKMNLNLNMNAILSGQLHPKKVIIASHRYHRNCNFQHPAKKFIQLPELQSDSNKRKGRGQPEMICWFSSTMQNVALSSNNMRSNVLFNLVNWSEFTRAIKASVLQADRLQHCLMPICISRLFSHLGDCSIMTLHLDIHEHFYLFQKTVQAILAMHYDIQERTLTWVYVPAQK